MMPLEAELRQIAKQLKLLNKTAAELVDLEKLNSAQLQQILDKMAPIGARIDLMPPPPVL